MEDVLTLVEDLFWAVSLVSVVLPRGDVARLADPDLNWVGTGVGPQNQPRTSPSATANS